MLMSHGETIESGRQLIVGVPTIMYLDDLPITTFPCCYKGADAFLLEEDVVACMT